MRRLVVSATVLGLLLAFAVAPAYSEGGPLSGYTICLDPGHGGSDAGAINASFGLEEKDINLDVAFGLKALLEADGATVVLTRTGDTYHDNTYRYTFCNAAQADLLISVHTNSVSNPDVDGSYVLHSPRGGDVEDQRLAQVIYDVIYPDLGEEAAAAGIEFTGFGIDKFASGVLFKSDMPAALVEPLFMSHPVEAAWLGKTIHEVNGEGVVTLSGGEPTLGGDCADLLCRRWQIVQSVRDGILAYAGNQPVNQPPVASFTADCVELTCTLNASASSDPDGTITTYAWELGDGGAATGETVDYTYGGSGTFLVTLTVTDDDGATAASSQDVTVNSGGGGAGIDLTVTAYKDKGLQKAELLWSGAAGADVDIYRDGSLQATTENDGSYVDHIDLRGPATYAYQLCEAGTQEPELCSSVVTASY